MTYEWSSYNGGRIPASPSSHQGGLGFIVRQHYLPNRRPLTTKISHSDHLNNLKRLRDLCPLCMSEVHSLANCRPAACRESHIDVSQPNRWPLKKAFIILYRWGKDDLTAN
ncbi:hypothetical protein PoB_003480700 [Plakobranchus ocellatus]|uniref:Reverse transcriptase zinc-binding domain-containing protein n=1 Tax=Plakobranchus ocellatus TaxID=259542 RepID=A0AAV4AM06_9GAST|nr:hypothetical protein PoB_003480700 [Plakobranchus ocellatus]